jgi:phospholipid/cholesterol/gamma-HCH transport system substrate-binding protein
VGAGFLTKHPSILIGLTALLVLGIFFALRHPQGHTLHLRCYFQDAHGLRVGSVVRLAGVEVGNVTGVSLHPEMRDHPVEVEMVLRTPYELKIPNDSVVTLKNVGLRGELYPQINMKNANGPPVEDGGTLRSTSD